MASELSSTFQALRDALRAHAEDLTVTEDTYSRFTLQAVVGPASLAAWGGRLRSRTIPVAWVEHGKTYVSYHLMGLGGNAALLATLSPALRRRMQGKTCFNFTRIDEALFAELATVTTASIQGLRRARYISEDPEAEHPQA